MMTRTVRITTDGKGLEIEYDFDDKPSDYKQGWYCRDEKWFLTFDAVLREFHITKKALLKLLISTHYGGVNYGKLEIKSSVNTYNAKRFSIYSLDDLKQIIPQQKTVGRE